jgi:hypothetical protein
VGGAVLSGVIAMVDELSAVPERREAQL